MNSENREIERTVESVSRDERLLHGRFPMGIMTAALAVTILAYGWLSWGAYKAYQDLIGFKALQLRTQELSGMLPICASCKKIRDDKGYWNQIETYIKAHSDAKFTHGICPECSEKLYPSVKIAALTSS